MVVMTMTVTTMTVMMSGCSRKQEEFAVCTGQDRNCSCGLLSQLPISLDALQVQRWGPGGGSGLLLSYDGVGQRGICELLNG